MFNNTNLPGNNNSTNSNNASNNNSSFSSQYQQHHHQQQQQQPPYAQSSNDRFANNHQNLPSSSVSSNSVPVSQPFAKSRYYPAPQIINPPLPLQIPASLPQSSSQHFNATSATANSRVSRANGNSTTNNNSSSARVAQQQQQHMPQALALSQTSRQQQQLQHHQHHAQQQHHHSSGTSSSRIPMVTNPLAGFKSRKDRTRRRLLDSYDIQGYIAAGTYGKYVCFSCFSQNFHKLTICFRVYKAKSRLP